MKKTFGKLPDGREAGLYIITCGALEAHITDFGATLVRLFVPNQAGERADVVLGYDDANGYLSSTAYFGATVGRNANRVKDGKFTLNGNTVQLPQNDGANNLHSGPDSYAFRLWECKRQEENLVQFVLHSPDGDQGFPGNADVSVTYAFTSADTLEITYDAISDKDTVFNLTNHTYFNMAGHDKPELAMGQTLCMPARFFTIADGQSIPTGEKRDVSGTPMDFRTPKAVGRDIGADYEALKLQGGYDHNFEVFCNPCAILTDPVSGRSVAVSTDCPGMQMYSGNFLTGEKGKDGVAYTYRGGVALETQYYPDAVNKPEWPQPVYKAGQRYHSVTSFTFK